MRDRRVTLAVIAKAPVAGRSKTRLCPPCSPPEAAALAEAALADTLDAVRATPADRHAVILDGEPGTWLPEGFEIHPQSNGGLDVRLAAGFKALGGPAVIVGMDTPQLTPGLLAPAVAAIADRAIDAVLGPASDGGYWAIGLRRPDPLALLGVPMSTGHTLAAQRESLAELGLRTVEVAELRDVDRWDDALAVAAPAPGTRFARVVEAVRAPERDPIVVGSNPG